MQQYRCDGYIFYGPSPDVYISSHETVVILPVGEYKCGLLRVTSMPPWAGQYACSIGIIPYPIEVNNLLIRGTPDAVNFLQETSNEERITENVSRSVSSSPFESVGR